MVTGSADRSLRLWERTDEPFFAEEERENRMESLFEADQPVSISAIITARCLDSLLLDAFPIR